MMGSMAFLIIGLVVFLVFVGVVVLVIVLVTSYSPHKARNMHMHQGQMMANHDEQVARANIRARVTQEHYSGSGPNGATCATCACRDNMYCPWAEAELRHNRPFYCVRYTQESANNNVDPYMRINANQGMDFGRQNATPTVHLPGVN